MAGLMDLPTEIRTEIYRYLPQAGWNSRVRIIKGFSGCSNTFRLHVMRINRKMYQELRDEMSKDLRWSFRIEIRVGEVDELRATLAKALADIRKQRDFPQARSCSITVALDYRIYRYGEFRGETLDINSLVRPVVAKKDILRHWLAWLSKADWFIIPPEHSQLASPVTIPLAWYTSSSLPSRTLVRYFERWTKWAPKSVDRRPPWRAPPGRAIGTR